MIMVGMARVTLIVVTVICDLLRTFSSRENQISV